MDHSKNYKRTSGGTVDKIRQRARQTESNLRKKRQEQLINRKRFRHDSGGGGEPDEVTMDEVVATTQEFLKDGDSRKTTLKLLRQAFAQGTVYVDAFLGIDDTMKTLIGCLTGPDAEVQLEAVWCFTNISAGVHAHVVSVVKSAAPYLITYLQSGSPRLQDQCAWCLGNLAGDSDECRDLLKAQGCMAALIPLIKSPHSTVVRSAAFALSNITKHSPESTKELLEAGVTDLLVSHLTDATDKTVLSEVGWVLSYLTTSIENIETVVKAGVIEPLVVQLIHHSKEDQHHGEVITPLLRCLGNICSGPDSYAIQACSNGDLLSALDRYLHSHHRHIQKEVLWVLSNVAGTAELCDAILTESIVSSLVNDVHSDYDIKLEALYVMCNLSSHGKKYCDALVAAGVMPYLVAILLSHDEETIDVALSLVEMLLHITENGKELFEASQGLTGLEAFEYHSNEKLRTKTNDILETYFYNEDITEELQKNQKESG